MTDEEKEKEKEEILQGVENRRRRAQDLLCEIMKMSQEVGLYPEEKPKEDENSTGR